MHIVDLKHIFQWYFSGIENWQCLVEFEMVNNSTRSNVLCNGFVISYIRHHKLFRNFLFLFYRARKMTLCYRSVRR